MTGPASLHDAEKTLEAARAKRYTAYPEYQPSGVDWLGEIPASWRVKRLKYVASINDEALPESADPTYEFSYVDIGNVSPTQGIVAKEPQVFEDAPSRARRIVRDGDTIVSTVRTYLRAIAPVRGPEDDLIVSTGFAVVRPRDIDPDYLSFALRSLYFVETVVSRSTGVSYPAINASEVGRIPIPLPPLDEQQAIACFLDEQTKKIDDLIVAKRDLLALLKEKRQAVITHAVTKGLDSGVALKPSGLDWLGDIPEHWMLKPMRYLGEAIIGLTYSPDDVVSEGAGMLVLRASNIQDGRIVDSDNVYVDAEVPPKLLTQADDILICSRSGSRDLIGKNALISPEVTGCTFGAFMTVFRSELNDFIYWVLNSRLFAFHSGAFMTTTINQLTLGTLKAFAIPLPPPPEQKAIVEHIKARTAVIDEVLSDVVCALRELTEMRTALISAAITGKVDVRGGAA